MSIVLKQPPSPPTPSFKATHAQVRVVNGVAHLVWLDVRTTGEVRCFNGSSWSWDRADNAAKWEFVREVPNKDISMEVPYA